jgi:hypothetical protein
MLPSELWHNVFQWVSASDGKEVAMVCKEWCTLWLPRLYSFLLPSGLDASLWEKFFLRRGRYVRKLYVWGAHADPTFCDLSLVARLCPLLRDLHIFTNATFPDTALDELSLRCQYLQRLTYPANRCTSPPRFPRVTSLRLYGDPFPQLQIPVSLTQLVTLKFRDISGLTTLDPVVACTALRHFSMEGCSRVEHQPVYTIHIHHSPVYAAFAKQLLSFKVVDSDVFCMSHFLTYVLNSRVVDQPRFLRLGLDYNAMGHRSAAYTTFMCTECHNKHLEEFEASHYKFRVQRCADCREDFFPALTDLTLYNPPL